MPRHLLQITHLPMFRRFDFTFPESIADKRPEELLSIRHTTFASLSDMTELQLRMMRR